MRDQRTVASGDRKIPRRHDHERLANRNPFVTQPTALVHPTLRILAFNKPYGVLPCFTDSAGRPTLADYIKVPDVYPAGRLDMDSEGLMLLTADGSLAHRITDPQHALPKVYWVQVERVPDEAALERLRYGVRVGGKRTRPATARLLGKEPQLPDRPVPIRFRKRVPTAWLELTLHEGMNRQVRRMTAAVGHPTLRLVRMAIGPIELGDLQPGRWRELTPEEVRKLTPRGGSSGGRHGRRTRSRKARISDSITRQDVLEYKPSR